MPDKNKRKKPVDAPAPVVARVSAKKLAAIIGPRLASARKGGNFTQGALAQAIKVVPGYVSMAELGQRLPSVEVLVAWGRACDVSVKEIFSGLEEELHLRERK